MIVRVFNAGRSRGESPVNYLLSQHSHTGEARSVAPEILEGNPATTIDIINNISRVNKYVSGVIAFRREEQPSRADISAVIETFHATFLPGIERDSFNALWVMHRDKGNTELHFVFPMVELTTGRRLNIHPPGPKNLALYRSFTEVVNHSLGYEQVKKQLCKASPSDYERKAGRTSTKRQSELLLAEIHEVVASGKVNNRAELCHFLDEVLGVDITRQGKDYLSVKLPGAAKALRLRGALFEEGSDFSAVRTELAQQRVPAGLSPSAFTASQKELQALVHERFCYNVKMYRTSRYPMYESVHGRTLMPSAPTPHIPLPNKGGTTITTTRKGEISMKKKQLVSTPVSGNQSTQTLIDDVKSQVKKIETQRGLSYTPMRKSSVSANIGIIRSRALNANGQNQSVGLDSMAMIQAAMVDLSQSISAAFAELRNAKTPQEESKARESLLKLEEQMRRLRAELQRIQTNAAANPKAKQP